MFWDCTFPPLVHIRESPEFSSIVNLDKSNWPRCLLWHGWLPALSGSTFGNPWAEDATRIAKNQLETALGSYVDAHRHPFDDFRQGERDFDVGNGPFVWSDGSLVVDKVSGVGVAGAGVYAHISGASWFNRRWAHLDLLPPLLDGGDERCRMYCSVPGPLQSVQRAEIWEVLIALQGQTALHVGVDNLNVVSHLSSLIASRWSGRPFPLVNDGDLLGLAQEIVHSRGRGTTLVSKVEGHADEGLVAMGWVREVDRIGNNEADAAADMGRRRVHDSITDARRLFNAACAHWYPIVKELQHFFVALARTVVNHDGSGGTTLHPTVWSIAANPKRRRVHRAVRDMAWLPGPESLWTSVWRSTQRAEVTEDFIRAWPFSVGLLVKISHFLATLRWPEGAHDLGLGGVSYLELLILYERWAGERLVLEKVLPYSRRAGRPISVSAVLVGPGIDIWRSCRFIGSIFRFLDRLPGGSRRFIPCNIGANHCRLRHIGCMDLHSVLWKLLIQVSLMISFGCSVTLVVLVHCFWLVSYR